MTDPLTCASCKWWQPLPRPRVAVQAGAVELLNGVPLDQPQHGACRKNLILVPVMQEDRVVVAGNYFCPPEHFPACTWHEPWPAAVEAAP